MNIPSKCLRCDRSFDWNEVIIWKMPENVWFCTECVGYLESVSPDTREYEWIESWIVTEYENWLKIELVN